MQMGFKVAIKERAGQVEERAEGPSRTDLDLKSHKTSGYFHPSSIPEIWPSVNLYTCLSENCGPFCVGPCGKCNGGWRCRGSGGKNAHASVCALFGTTGHWEKTLFSPVSKK